MIQAASKLWHDLKRGAILSIGRFPLLIVCTSMIAIVELIRVQLGLPKGNSLILNEVQMIGAVGVPLFFGLTLFRERVQCTPLIELLGIPLLVGYYFLPKAALFREPYASSIQWGLLLVGLHLLCAVIGFFRGPETRGFWQFNRQIFSRFILASTYTVILVAGMELAIYSADKLFNLKLNHSYSNAAVIIIGFFHPIFFVSGVPSDWRALDSDSKYPNVLKVFTQIVLAPLVAVFTVILYVYALKIASLGQWPKGWVALPVILLSGFGILAVLLLHPIKDDPQQRWARWFTKFFPKALAPLAVLLLLSVRIRIMEYGLTEPRYVGGVAAFWLLVWSFILIRNPRSGIRWIPTSLAVLGFVSAIGPVSATALSLKSQHARFCEMLEKRGRLDLVTPPPETSIELDKREYTNLRVTLIYLLTTHGRDSVSGVLKPVWKDEWNQASQPAYSVASGILSALHLSEKPDDRRARNDIWALNARKPLTQAGYQRVSIFPELRDGGAYSKCSDGVVWVAIEGEVLKLAFAQDGPFTEVPLDSLSQKLPSRSDNQLSPESLSVDWECEGHSLRIVFQEILGRRSASGALLIKSCRLVLFER
jgi:hypothetical protein